MAQLIKLQDYVSRYAQDIYLYPSRYVRLKKQQWGGLKDKWENPPNEHEVITKDEPASEHIILRKIKRLIRPLEGAQTEHSHGRPYLKDAEQEELIDYEAVDLTRNIHSLDELKQHFLDQLLPFQLKWASSTLTEKSYIDKEFYVDKTLRFLLQRFPDTFLILYKPIFLLKKAPVEAELIIITPASAICISFLEAEEDAVFVGSKERFWIKKTKNREVKILNPLLGLNRTEKIVKALFDMYDVELPVQKLLISRNGFIDYTMQPYGVQFVEKRNFENWFRSLRTMKSPLKHMQLKAAQALLQYCQTTSFRRLEWEKPPEE